MQHTARVTGRRHELPWNQCLGIVLGEPPIVVHDRAYELLAEVGGEGGAAAIA